MNTLCDLPVDVFNYLLLFLMLPEIFRFNIINKQYQQQAKKFLLAKARTLLNNIPHHCSNSVSPLILYYMSFAIPTLREVNLIVIPKVSPFQSKILSINMVLLRHATNLQTLSADLQVYYYEDDNCTTPDYPPIYQFKNIHVIEPAFHISITSIFKQLKHIHLVIYDKTDLEFLLEVTQLVSLSLCIDDCIHNLYKVRSVNNVVAELLNIHNTTIENFRIHTTFETITIQHILEILGETKLPKVKFLELCENEIGALPKSAAQLLWTTMPHIKSLYILQATDVPHSVLTQLIQNLRHLEDLKVFKEHRFSKLSLRNQQFPNLKYLMLDEQYEGVDPTVEYCASIFPNLDTLSFRNTAYCDEDGHLITHISRSDAVPKTIDFRIQGRSWQKNSWCDRCASFESINCDTR